MPTGNKELKKPTKEKISMEIATKKGDAGVAVKSSNTKTAIKTPNKIYIATGSGISGYLLKSMGKH